MLIRDLDGIRKTPFDANDQDHQGFLEEVHHLFFILSLFLLNIGSYGILLLKERGNLQKSGNILDFRGRIPKVTLYVLHDVALPFMRFLYI